MKKLLFTSIIIATLISTGGCSAISAVNGSESPDFSLFTQGQSRGVIETEPLKPTEVKVLENGNILATYKYNVGKEASSGRAAVYIGLDLLTGFASELITFPMELMRGEKKKIKVEYTPNGELIKVY